MTRLLRLALVCMVSFQFASASEIDRIKQNYRDYFLNPSAAETELTADLIRELPKETWFSDQVIVELMQRYPVSAQEIKYYLACQSHNGNWTDIDYENQNMSGWMPQKHVERLLDLVKVYRLEGSGFTGSTAVKEAIRNGLWYWFRNKPRSENWWFNEIGMPKVMGSVLLLFEDELTEDELKYGIQIMRQAEFGRTGQNKVWLAGNVLVRALLQRDEVLLREAREQIVSEIRDDREEGIKPDHSFHQHGPQQQFGNYGCAYLLSMGFWGQVFKGTDLRFDRNQLDILNGLIEDGYGRILWNGYMDVNALGRQFFHNTQRHKAYSTAFTSLIMADIDSLNRYRYIALVDDNFASPPRHPSHEGVYAFWMTDQAVCRRPRWMASVKMSSPRVIGAEAGNGDNLKGYYLADGAMYTYVNGAEYRNIFPTWDWRMIPGTTTYYTSGPLPELSWDGYRNGSDFVGTVTDGNMGLTAMHLQRDGLEARKAWIFTDDFILCLGAGIRSDSTATVITTIEQNLQHTDLLHQVISGWESATKIELRELGAQRFHQGNTGYITYDAVVSAISAREEGRWQDIMQIYPDDFIATEDVFTLWINHGEQPQSGSYRYLVLPASTPEEVSDFDLDRVDVWGNYVEVQHVNIGDTHYCVLYEDLTTRIGEYDLELEPGLYMIRESEDRNALHIWYADPTQTKNEVIIVVNGQSVTYNLPTGVGAGTSLFIAVPIG